MRLPWDEQSERWQYLRPEPCPRSSRRFSCIVRHMRLRVFVHDDRHRVSHRRVGRTSRLPPAGFHVAACLSPTVDVHLAPGVLEFPLAPTLSTQFCRVWSSSRRSALREAWCRHGCFCRIRRHAPRCLVGAWEWDGIHHRRRLLPSHGRRCDHGGRVYEGDWVTGWRMDGLVVDDGLDDTVGYVHDRWVGPTWFICCSISSGWIPTGESSHRCYHCYVKRVTVA